MRLTAGQQHRSDRVGRSSFPASRDKFFTDSKCGRCKGSLQSRTMSWFTEETICMTCSGKEAEIKKTLRAKGIDGAMEGCGYIPDPDKV